MGQTIKLKRSATPNAVPTSEQLELGELAINTNDGKVFIKKGDSSVVDITAPSSLSDTTGIVLKTDNSGNIGIGTDDNSPDAVQARLHVADGDSTLSSSSVGTMFVETAADTSLVLASGTSTSDTASVEFKRVGGDTASVSCTNNILQLSADSANSAYKTIKVDPSGRVGIGNTNFVSDRKLDVHCSTSASSDTAGGVRIIRKKSGVSDNGLLELTNTGTSSGRIILMTNGTTLRGLVGLSKTFAGTHTANPFFSHVSGTGITCAYSTSSSYNSIIPCTNEGLGQHASVNLGNPSIRFKTLWISDSSVNTSDRNLKQNIEDISAAEIRVAQASKGLLKKYKFISAVQEKGEENARLHFGIIAQDLKAAFEAEGLDAHKYGVFCSDTWYEHEGQTYPTQEEAPEGATEVTQLGVRYEELLAFIIAGI